MREALAQGVQAPFIFLTGQGNREVDMEAMKLGAADYLAKDRIDASLLERTIRYAIERQRLLQEQKTLVEELQEALSQVKVLSGLLPICSYCKKIRDDQGYWKEVDQIDDRAQSSEED